MTIFEALCWPHWHDRLVAAVATGLCYHRVSEEHRRFEQAGETLQGDLECKTEVGTIVQRGNTDPLQCRW